MNSEEPAGTAGGGARTWSERRPEELRPGDVFLLEEEHVTVMVLDRPYRIYKSGGGGYREDIGVAGRRGGDMTADDYEFEPGGSCRLVACGVRLDWASMTAGEFAMIGDLVGLGGFDPTPYGMDGDRCPLCGEDWKDEHRENCLSPWRREELLATVMRLRGLDDGQLPRTDEVTAGVIALCRKAGMSAAEAVFEAERIRDAYLSVTGG